MCLWHYNRNNVQVGSLALIEVGKCCNIKKLCSKTFINEKVSFISKNSDGVFAAPFGELTRFTYTTLESA